MDGNDSREIGPGESDDLAETGGDQATQDTVLSYPAAWVELVELPDGQAVKIRPIRPQDARILRAAFKYLSTQTIFLRFHGSVTQLSEAQARSYAEVDYRRRMAFVACLPEEKRDLVIGVARYNILAPEDAGLAECAVVVGDLFQKRGIGSLLLNRLFRYAITQGIREIQATVHPSNQTVLRFIEKSGLAMTKKFSDGAWEIRVKLPE